MARQSESSSDLVRSTVNSTRGGRVGEKEGREGKEKKIKKERKSKERERKKLFGFVQVFKTRIYTLLEFSN